MIRGGPGNDIIHARFGVDINVEGGTGADTMYSGDDGGDLYGGAGDDTLLGGKGVDLLYGEAGDDLIYGGSELLLGVDQPGDLLLGGPGFDDIFGEGGDDTILGDDPVAALTDGADWVSGGTGADMIWGGGGPDVLYGDAGDDEIYSAFPDAAPGSTQDKAADHMYGGTGSDAYGGFCTDLDVAHEETDPVADIDSAYNVDGLLLFVSYFEVVQTCP